MLYIGDTQVLHFCVSNPSLAIQACKSVQHDQSWNIKKYHCPPAAPLPPFQVSTHWKVFCSTVKWQNHPFQRTQPGRYQFCFVSSARQSRSNQSPRHTHRWPPAESAARGCSCLPANKQKSICTQGKVHLHLRVRQSPSAPKSQRWNVQNPEIMYQGPDGWCTGDEDSFQSPAYRYSHTGGNSCSSVVI